MKNRKSTAIKMLLQSNTRSQNIKLFEQEIAKCPMSQNGCQAVIIGNQALLQHLETECNYFMSKASENIKQKLEIERDSFLKENNLIRLLINKVKSTPTLETIDRTFVPLKMQTQYCVQTKKPDRFPKLTVFKRIDLVREIEDSESMELGSVPMKSNIVCSYSIYKNKNTKIFFAYRSSNFSILIRDFNGLVIKRLEGHSDHITEIKYFKNEKDENLLYSSSFDSNLIIWNLDTFLKQTIINFDSWILSSSMMLLKKQNTSLIAVAGGYYKNHPIKFYNIFDGNFEFEISIADNVSIEIVQTLVDEDQGKYYLFAGTDTEKPMVIWYDFRLKNKINTFQAYSSITSITIDHSNKGSCMIFTDSSGGLKQVDLITGKLVTDFKLNCPILDLTIWDSDYFIVSGGHKDNSIKVLTRAKTRLLKSFDNLHSKVILNISKVFNVQNGVCLVTVGGDKKIKLQKLF